MPTAHMFEVVVIFSDGQFAKVDVNCTNSIEAIKAVLSTGSVVGKIEDRTEKLDIVDVKCSKKVLRY